MKFLKPPKTERKAVDRLTNDRPDFVSIGFDASVFIQFSKQWSRLGLQLSPTKVIDYKEDERIAYRYSSMLENPNIRHQNH